MATLPTNTFTNPQVSFYADLGAGDAGNELQSPASVLPDGGGDVSLSLIASTGSGEADLLVSSTNGNGATITVNSTTGGDAVIAIGQGAVPGGSGYVLITAPGAIVGGGQIQIENGSGTGGSIATFDTVGNQVFLGQTTSDGLTVIRNGLEVRDTFVTTDQYGIGLTVTAPLMGVIAMTSATGSLSLGSSSTNPDIIKLTQGASVADTGVCTIGGNGDTNLVVTGGTVAAANVGANISTDAPSSGIMTIGSSVANPTVMFVKDAGAANTGFVDVAGGIPASIALRLQGANTAVGANTAQISTNNVNSASPTLNINNSVDGTPAIVVSSTTVRINKLITGYLNGTTAAQAALADNTSVGIPGSDYGSLGAGLFTILVKNGNQTTTGQPGVQVSAMGYMSSTTTLWIGGGGFGQGLVNPTRNFFIQPNPSFTGLIFGNTSGFDMNSTWQVLFIRMTGDLGI